MSQYFPKPYELFEEDISVKVGLSNYGIWTDLNNAAGIDTSKSAAKPYLVSLRDEPDKLNIDKLVATPVDLSKTKWCSKKWCS